MFQLEQRLACPGAMANFPNPAREPVFLRIESPLPSSLTWLDHDSAARDRSLRVLALFRKKESRDELVQNGIRIQVELDNLKEKYRRAKSRYFEQKEQIKEEYAVFLKYFDICIEKRYLEYYNITIFVLN